MLWRRCFNPSFFCPFSFQRRVNERVSCERQNKQEDKTNTHTQSRMSVAKSNPAKTCFVGADECALFEALVSRWRVPVAFADTRTPIATVLRDLHDHLASQAGAPVTKAAAATLDAETETVGRWVEALAGAVSPYPLARTHALCVELAAAGAWPLVRVGAGPASGRAPVSAARVLLRRPDCPRAFRRWVAALLRDAAADPRAAEATASAAVHAALAAGTAFDDAHWCALLPLQCRDSAENPAPVAAGAAPVSGVSRRVSAQIPAQIPAPVEGESRQLEKPYARLTRAADPACVRPAAVLAAALAHAEAEQRAGRWDYARAREQYKAMRQDLAVQHLAGPLARAVYASSARAALAAADYGELSLCLQHVWRLLPSDSDARAEFACYRLLLALLVGDGGAARDVVAAHAGTRTPAPPLRTCLALAHLFLAGAWPAFVRRALAASSSDSAVLARAHGLLGLLVEQARFQQLRALCRACFRTVPRALLLRALGFADGAACSQYCAALGLDCDAETGALAVEAARTRLAALPVPSVPLDTL